MLGYFLCTAARTRASTGFPLARASAFLAWLASSMGYERSGPAKFLPAILFLAAAFSLATATTLSASYLEEPARERLAPDERQPRTNPFYVDCLHEVHADLVRHHGAYDWRSGRARAGRSLRPIDFASDGAARANAPRRYTVLPAINRDGCRAVHHVGSGLRLESCIYRHACARPSAFRR